MKLNKTLLVLASTFALSACNLSDINDGQTDDPVWPDVETNLDLSKGTFPDLTALEQVKEGMTKDQLYYLIGRPHHGEGFFGVKEWDYTFHFHTPGQGTNGITTCQFKVLFDNNRLTRSFFWKAVDPADAVCGQAKPQRFTLASDALFAFDKSDLRAGAQSKLDELVQKISQFDRFQGITVTGYTDRLGNHDYNVRLSQKRAQTVADYLTGHGIPADRIQVRGLGPQSPVSNCSKDLGRKDLISCLQADRRVDVEVAGSGVVKAAQQASN
ncbi:OmpA family protein [Brackiella oedipodis]|uniref:OmpA family protein n=1 Tax=Brackiella oedipodis TaxID=124225 RepID=UPI00048C9607|nr:OmpA family protein [Brackiella oedipodis]